MTTITAIKEAGQYTVEETNNPRMPYMLHGKRNAVYGLMRQVGKDGQPKMHGPMFAINGKTGAVVRIRGFRTEWVEEG